MTQNILQMRGLVLPQAVLASLNASTKKDVLTHIASAAAGLVDQNAQIIFDILWEREKLGTTGVGHGIAIPHGKLPKLNQLFGIFARLEKPLDFEALDGEPVDLIFLLLAPEGAGADHLKALSRVARALRDPAIAQKLRKSHDASALFAMLTQTPTATAA